MSYEPTTWATGDTVTAEKLNNMEGGIESATPFMFNVEYTSGGYTTPLTPGELTAAIMKRQLPTAVVINSPDSDAESLILPFRGFLNNAYSFAGVGNGVGGGINYFDVFIFDDGNNLTLQVSVSSLPVPFIVTLTPTNLDFSGTMDATAAQIRAAYDAGKQIVFAVPDLNASLNATMFAPIGDDSIIAGVDFTYVDDSSGGQDQHLLIAIRTDYDSQTYQTTLYPLTPM